ncbi:carbamoyl-phosphate synthase small chain [Clostridium homopropionicum DSM 5847]|uniref:Carbamoyl-phosphate synthase small chain n=1 Tax=Clostridium homopropionicum DSM 5847 TaxID=1121318 RepID=A0A0L6ZDH3_9CLOT|nr:gamma-glutamyl-gamma-aminobutyrate hydrolase family protein [Clostridium homopropionicum]KOA21026.1 carbamoyl-phosphate synthase small chain [Clostridium homopropionicum DSM 5847]SFF99124.1 putative glutamine amidotransferase [Clostridium homopropionicum]
MKLIGVTQRVDFIKEYNEKRDSIDQKWIEFLNQCNLTPILLPNNLEVVKNIISSLKLQGMLFTGGNSLIKYEGNSLERDNVEKFCMDFSIENNIPLLGVCRGMQFIQDYFGISLEKVNGHISNSQQIILNGKVETVNSFHNWGSKKSNNELLVTAMATDGVIKAIKHVKYNVLGIMWHPERIYPFSKRDINLFNDFYK